MNKFTYQLKSVLAALVLTVAVLAGTSTVIAQNGSNGQETCPETGDGWIKVDGLSEYTETFTNIPDGYEVTDNCYKAGTTVIYGSGPTVTSSVFNSPQGVTCTAVGVPHEGCNYQKLSHASFKLERIQTPNYYFNFVKVWEGDEIDLDEVTVTLSVDGSSLAEGEKLPVEPGQTLENLEEIVEGLPENCSYESDLVPNHTVFDDMLVDARIFLSAVNGINGPVDTLTITNTVTCEDEDEVITVVEGATTTQIKAVPVGAADAGAGASLSGVLAGLFGSAGVAGLGVLTRRFSL